MSDIKLQRIQYLIEIILLAKQDALNAPLDQSKHDQAIAQLAAYNALLAALTEKEVA